MGDFDNDKMTEAEIKEAKKRRNDLLRELKSRGELPRDNSESEQERMKRTWQRSI